MDIKFGILPFNFNLVVIPVPTPPFLVDDDNNFLVDDSGNFLIGDS